MAEFSFQNKTVVFIIKVCSLAGAERQALGLASYLKENYNCKIHFVATHSAEQTDEFRNFALKCGVQNIEYYGTPSLAVRKGFSYANFKKTLRAYFYLNKVKKGIKNMKPDVIIPYMNFASKLSALIYKDVGAKYTFWHELGESDNYYYDILEKKAVKQIPFFCANAKDGFNTFQNYYGVKEGDCNLLTQYVSFAKIDFDVNVVKEELGIPKNKLVYGMIAHFRDQKHPELLMEAFSKIAFEKEIHLVFLGNKDNDASTLKKYNSLVDLSKKLNIQDKVSLLSGASVEKVLSAIDVGVLVSEFEGAPTVLMEYMMYGKPIIATDHVGCKLLMGESEFLVAKNDVNSLENKMVKLYENPDLRNQIAEKHVELVKKYSLENYCLRLKELFEKYS
ncbi:glycosyltransferase family 4 protein [Flavobacterium sp.]|jgi:glycosyltransferase involved in cell wall biosynthesis|uniref:glycosyltransferase family 4 protein n=1 Tax=Flavobacterium sp. TaxID=239 RepID=UPI002A826F5E|nr:glycosyltransferase family 4 protein [Flavobacterium sp.]